MRGIALVLLLAVSASAQQKEEPATMEMDGTPPRDATELGSVSGVSLDRLTHFPEDFAGQTLTMDLWISGDMKRLKDGTFALNVKAERTGTLVISGVGYADQISFFVSNALAREMQEHMQGGYDMSTRAAFTVRRVRIGNSEAQWAALVTVVDFVNLLREPVHHVAGPAPAYTIVKDSAN